MKRDLVQLSRQSYDVLIIGGGIYGACVAWDAALRGLSVALLEKGDFGHATSSNTLRIIHGGLRYLQHGDIRRMRQSTYERTVFTRIAPHLVHPLPFLIPTYGNSMRGKGIFSLALFLYDLIAVDHNGSEDPQRRLPRGRIVSREECLGLFPDVDKTGLTGAAILYDCQMSSSERLVLSFIRSAVGAGAEIANYVEVAGLIKEGTRVTGVKARDVFTGDDLDIHAKVVVNSTGPWLDRILSSLNGHRPRRKMVLSKAFNLLLKRQLVPQYAVGVYGRGPFRDRDAILSKGYRLYFITPWRNRSLIGTVHLPHESDPDHIEVHETEIDDFLDEINQAYGAANITRGDVCLVYKGLLPASGYKGDKVQLVKNCRVCDHEKEDGVGGLISVVGVKFTEARHVAERTVDLVFRKLGKMPPQSTTAATPLHGGRIENLQSFLTQEIQRSPRNFNAEIIQQLIYDYGSAYPAVLKYLDGDAESVETSSDESRVFRAQVRHAVEEEMAQKLTDVMFRRLTLMNGPAKETRLKTCASIVSKELGWNSGKTRSEIEEAQAALVLGS
jgi:glycerol-3-phosphate dehydrogenase